jgi:hypothetical protein
MQYVMNLEDLDEMCKTIANELDIPEGFYFKANGKGESKRTIYFRIKGNTARLEEIKKKINLNDESVQEKINGKSMFFLLYRVNTPGIRFRSKFYSRDYFSALKNIIELSEEYVINFGLDCPKSILYWIIYRIMYETIEFSGFDPFDCCSRYLECSDTYKCTQLIKADRYDCRLIGSAPVFALSDMLCSKMVRFLLRAQNYADQNQITTTCGTQKSMASQPKTPIFWADLRNISTSSRRSHQSSL